MTKPSSTNLSPCVCGAAACGPEKDMDTGMPAIWCSMCWYRILCMNKSDAIALWNAAMRGLSIANLDQAWQRIYDLFEKPNSQAHDEVLFDVNHGERSAIHWALSEIEKLGGMDPSKRSKK